LPKSLSCSDGSLKLRIANLSTVVFQTPPLARGSIYPTQYNKQLCGLPAHDTNLCL